MKLEYLITQYYKIYSLVEPKYNSIWKGDAVIYLYFNNQYVDGIDYIDLINLIPTNIVVQTDEQNERDI